MRKLSSQEVLGGLQGLGTIVALVISLLAYWDSHHAYVIAHDEYIERKLAVWHGEVKEGSLRISGTSPEIQLQFATLRFPKEITEEEFHLHPPDFGLPTTRFEFGFRHRLEAEFTRTKGAVKVVEGYVPFLLSARYTCDGQMCEDESLYDLHYIYVVPEPDALDEPVKFDGVSFMGRAVGGNGLADLESVFSEANAAKRPRHGT